MKKICPTSVVLDEEMKRKIVESPIARSFGISGYLRYAVTKFIEFEERERQREQNEKSKN